MINICHLLNPWVSVVLTRVGEHSKKGETSQGQESKDLTFMASSATESGGPSSPFCATVLLSAMKVLYSLGGPKGLPGLQSGKQWGSVGSRTSSSLSCPLQTWSSVDADVAKGRVPIIPDTPCVPGVSLLCFIFPLSMNWGSRTPLLPQYHFTLA